MRPFVLAVGLVALFAVAPQGSGAAVAHTQTFAYGTHARQALDAHWNDPAEGTQPGIVIVHGGAWSGGGGI